MRKLILFVFLVLTLFVGNDLFAQVPNISYTPSINNYIVGTTISTLSPSNSGAVSALTAYGLPTSLSATNINGPNGMATDALANVYVCNYSGGNVIYYNSSGVYQGIFVSGLSSPTGIVFDSKGNCYVLDAGNKKVYKYNSCGVALSNFTLTGATTCYGFAIDASDNLYITNYNGTSNYYVFKYNTNTSTQSTIITTTNLDQPAAAAIDPLGNIFVLNGNVTNNLVKFNSSGTPVTNNFGTGYNTPYGLAVDQGGYIYVGDYNNSKILVYNKTGTLLSTITNGVSGPDGLAFDTKGNVYSSNYFSSTVTKYAPNGGYFLDKKLPAGLFFDGTTGNITGTPTAASPSATYTITAYNASGPSSTTISIRCSLTAPTVSYSSPQSYSVGVNIATLSPTTGGSPVPANTYSTVSTFASAATNISNPRGMTVDAFGNVYEADFTGNAIYMVNTAGVATKIAGSGTGSELDGSGLAATFNGPTGIVYDGANYLYIVDNGGNKIRRMSIACPYAVTTIAGNGTASETTNTTGTLATFNKPYGIAYDGTANLYITDFTGNTVRKISTTAPYAVTNLATSGFNGPAGIVYDGSGNLYVTNASGNTISKVTTGGTVSTFAGSGSVGSTNATGTAASFSAPYGIAMDASKNLIVADEGNNLIRAITTPGAVVTTLAGDGTLAELDGLSTDAEFYAPYTVAADQSGNIYVGDNNTASSTIRKLILTGFTISPALPTGLSFDGTTGNITGSPGANSSSTTYTITGYNAAGSGSGTVNITVTTPPAPSITYTGSPYTYSTGVAIAALIPANSGGSVPTTTYGTVSTLASGTLNKPRGIATDGAGNIYEADFTGNFIYKISASGVITKIAGSGTKASTNGNGTGAAFANPSGIVYDGSTFLYIVDNFSNKIRRMSIAPPYTVLTIAGSGTASETTNTTGTLATFNAPYGITYDGAGSLYVTDFAGNTIRKVSTTSPFAVSNLATTGLSGPTGIVYDGSANLYVANATSNKILKVTTSGGTVSVFAGSGTAGATNATGALATFKTPYGVTFDVTGNLLVADEANFLIRTITVPGAVVTTLAGSGNNADLDGVTTVARFATPYCIVADHAGNVFVGDNGGTSTLRQIVLTGYTINLALPAGLNFDNTTGYITGTPTATSPATPYTITAYNASGSSATTININVVLGIPNISYSPTPVSLLLNKAVGTAPNPAITFTSNGGAVPGTTYSTVSTLLSGTISGPRGIVADAAGNIYEADYGGNAIYKITTAGVATKIAGSTAGEVDNATGTSAKLSGPTGITYDGSAFLYVVDNVGKTIRKISTTAPYAVTTIASTGFTAPWGICYDAPDGWLYVTDFGGNKIYKITTTGTVTTIVSSGLSGPAGIVYDGLANLYVANTTGNTVLKVTTAGAVSTFAGAGGAGAFLDGTGTAAKFNAPYGVTFDATGNLIVADQANNRIRTITVPGAVVTTLAGSGTATETNGVGTNATFTSPYCVTTDILGNAFAGDNGGTSTIRKIILTGYTVSPTLPTGLTFAPTSGVIAGTPTVSTAAANYTVTAYNASGSSSTIINITCYINFVWQGTTSSDWNATGNWVSGIIPSSADQVQIGVTTQTITNLPIITTTVNAGSIALGTRGNKAAIIEVDGAGFLNITGDITLQSDASSLTNAAYATGFTSVTAGGTVKAANLNIIASTTLNSYTETLNSSVTNLTLSGNINLTTNWVSVTQIENARFNFTGGTLTVDGIATNNNNSANTSTLSLSPTTALNFTGANVFSGLSQTAGSTNTITISSPTIGYTGVNDQTVYTDVAIPYSSLSSGISYTGLAFSGSGIKTASGGNLNISGNFTNNLTSNATTTYVDLSNTTVNFTGTGQALAGGAGTGTKLYNSVFNGGAKTMSGKFTVDSQSLLTMNGTSGTTLDAGSGSLTLNSDATSSASISSLKPASGSITGVINGTVNVQRFMTGNNNISYRGYRLLSSPVSDPASSTETLAYGYFNLSYLKGTGTSGSGSYLTGGTGSADGFDAAGNPTVYFYREDLVPNNSSFTSGNYRGVNKINNSPKLYSIGIVNDGSPLMPVGNGYLYFYRGNNGTNTSTIPSNLIFSSLGRLNQGQITVRPWFNQTTNLSYTTPTGPSDPRFNIAGFNLVGNPYPSSIDWNTAYDYTLPGPNTTSTKGIYATNIDQAIYIYNNQSKNYDTYLNSAGPGGSGTNGITNIIPVGQGFFVRATSASAQLIFNESAKINDQPDVLLLNSAIASAPAKPLLRLQLAKDAISKDETIIILNSKAHTAYVQNEDAVYLKGIGAVNLSNMSSDRLPLAISQVPLPQNKQTIPLNITVNAAGPYTLNLTEIKNLPDIYDVWLMDGYTKDSLDIKHNPTYSFAVSADTASTGTNRFKLVIRLNAVKAVHLLSFTGVQDTKQIKLTWTAENEENYTTYVLQRSIDGGHTFTTLDSLTSANLGTYNDLDPNPVTGINLYRLKQVDVIGNVSYSAVLSFSYSPPIPVSDNNNAVSVYPNPVKYILGVVIKPKGGKSGNYKITITNNMGIIIKTGTTTIPIWLNDVVNLLPGTYFINVTSSKDNSLVGRATFIKL